MKNKKAWLRIVEASIAVLIIISSVLIISVRQPSGNEISEEIYEIQKYIIESITKDNLLRQDILNEDPNQINTEIEKLIPPSLAFSTAVCNIDDICSNPEPIYDREVYTSERIVTATLTDYNPKRLRFFVWRKD